MWAKIVGQIAHAGFKGGLGHTHHVVVWKDALASQVGQRDDATAAAFSHKRQRGARHRDQRVGANAQRGLERLPGCVQIRLV